MAKFPSYEILYALVCDDVRREDNGKWFYIGVYPYDLVLQDVPTQLVLRVIFRLKPRKKGPANFECRLLLDQAVVAGMAGEINSQDLLEDNFPTPPLLVAIPHAGSLTIQVRESDEDAWRVIARHPVKHASKSAIP